jgi:hypothetical protein
VETLVQHVPLVVVDAIHLSLPLVSETFRLFETGSTYKVVFFVPSTTEAPLLAFLAPDVMAFAPPIASVSRGDDLMAIVKYCTQSNVNFPRPDRDCIEILTNVLAQDGQPLCRAASVESFQDWSGLPPGEEAASDLVEPAGSDHPGAEQRPSAKTGSGGGRYVLLFIGIAACFIPLAVLAEGPLWARAVLIVVGSASLFLSGASVLRRALTRSS